MNDKPYIVINNLTFSYTNPVLSNISLSINIGEYLGITGPNGGGKTTLIKLIIGALEHKGTIIKSHNMIIGYLPQLLSSTIFNFPTTVKELLLNTSASLDKYQEIITEFSLENLVNHQITNLSGGQRQRVFIARAMLLGANMLILDEPTTGVDEEHKIIFWQLLKKLNKQGIGIIIISHDLTDINQNAKRVININKTIQYDKYI
jgi:zinc transport system ATP-binding protein